MITRPSRLSEIISSEIRSVQVGRLHLTQAKFENWTVPHFDEFLGQAKRSGPRHSPGEAICLSRPILAYALR